MANVNVTNRDALWQTLFHQYVDVAFVRWTKEAAARKRDDCVCLSFGFSLFFPTVIFYFFYSSFFSSLSNINVRTVTVSRYFYPQMAAQVMWHVGSWHAQFVHLQLDLCFRSLPVFPHDHSTYYFLFSSPPKQQTMGLFLGPHGKNNWRSGHVRKKQNTQTNERVKMTAKLSGPR